MGRSRKNSLNGKRLAIDKEREKILQEIVNTAVKEKSINRILEIVKNPNIGISTKSMLAKIYLNTVKTITQKVFFKSTLRKIAKSIRQLEICLQENNLQNTAKELREGWNRWITKELWQKVRPKIQNQEQKTENQDELSILKGYLND